MGELGVKNGVSDVHFVSGDPDWVGLTITTCGGVTQPLHSANRRSWQGGGEEGEGHAEHQRDRSSVLYIRPLQKRWIGRRQVLLFVGNSGAGNLVKLYGYTSAG